MNQERKPVFEQRLGTIRVTIWENEDKDGNAFYNSTIVRRYKSGTDDQGNEEWNNSYSFTGLSDLALLDEAVQLAKSWLRQKSLTVQL